MTLMKEAEPTAPITHSVPKDNLPYQGPVSPHVAQALGYNHFIVNSQGEYIHKAPTQTS